MKNRLFVCPVCRGNLFFEENCLRCDKNHSFDLSRYGYVNLLLPQKGGCHGDNRDMIAARHRFLESGNYAFLANAVAETVSAHLPQNGVLLDAGCGEGYYTAAMENMLSDMPHRACGIDISRDALKVAARRLPNVDFAVGSLYDMPLPDASADLVTLLFAPFADAEIRRVLRKNGILLMVIPERFHLFGLKKVLYETPYENEVADFALDGYTLLSADELRKTVTLEDRDTIRDLFYMTPYAYRTRKEDAEKLLALPALTTEFSFRVLVYRVNGTPKA